jgi:ADP-ribosyl-[dinitrogen reductase] hydrolase
MSRFTLEPRNWYAMELISPEFEQEVRRCSPIRVDAVELAGNGSRRFDLSFFHAAYPEGVQNKVYTIQTIQRTDHFLLGRVADTSRLVLLLKLSDSWLNQHFDKQALKYLRLLQADSAPDPQDRYNACLLGGAIGDALGGAVEFMSRSAIVARFGPEGITDYAEAYGGKGKITDDTQMTLFTAEGLLRGRMRGISKGITGFDHTVANAYLRWLATQGQESLYGSPELDGWLYKQRELHNQRAPGMTCLSALRDYQGESGIAGNNSKGCGGVMRVAPVGLFWWSFKERVELSTVFEDGKVCAEITHGHPSGYLTGGVLAVLIFVLLDGATLDAAVAQARSLLVTYRGHEETLDALNEAITLSSSGLPHHEAIEQLGEGWVAEEALAISVYCALVAESFEQGIVLAVNHDGDSDSTGAITGNLLGAMQGTGVISERWLEPLELRAVIEAVASDLWTCQTWHSSMDDSGLWERYPGY